MRAKLNTEEGKRIYSQRAPEVEPVFGNLKQNQGFTGFHTRGKPMVLTETGLRCCAHNLVKIYKAAERMVKEIENMPLYILTRIGTAI